jgi:hypothetical protein
VRLPYLCNLWKGRFQPDKESALLGHMVKHFRQFRQEWPTLASGTPGLRISPQRVDRRLPSHADDGARISQPVMDRLAFIAIMGGSIVVAPLVSEAQQSVKVANRRALLGDASTWTSGRTEARASRTRR